MVISVSAVLLLCKFWVVGGWRFEATGRRAGWRTQGGCPLLRGAASMGRRQGGDRQEVGVDSNAPINDASYSNSTSNSLSLIHYRNAHERSQGRLYVSQKILRVEVWSSLMKVGSGKPEGGPAELDLAMHQKDAVPREVQKEGEHREVETRRSTLDARLPSATRMLKSANENS
ncbi:hypothetical protein B0H17DRAFT_1141895 [Mycena rosella]|uniref:Uncharacterized protein n=1 Tax=Mycena rosella TaxID=1033263 RepID=A0AAD7CYG3_MYCRO|nr:hypothetical protein B0H17DRAFT_1141895 [Mycena rosella]